MIRLWTLAGFLGLTMGGVGIAAPAGPAPAHRSAPAATVRITPAGSHLIGNPDARVKLVEYISYTCSHCARFNQVSQGPLRTAYLRPGKVSIEVRNLVRDPIDLTAAMLANCGPPARFPANHDMFLATQDRWLALATGASDEQRKRWDAGPIAARLKIMATDLGFYPMMAGRGYRPAQLDACLADAALLKRVVAQTEGAEKAGVNATPSFLVNGRLTDAHDWPGVETLVKAAL